ncbi:MAG: TlyA family RNA methyltransferase [Clostridia bacterium]|nr:TlyA family RNA methyltransferase [Clostridia bacterium]
MRLDVYLAETGLAKSRSRAAQLISGGFISVNGKIITKASYDVTETDEVRQIGEEHKFVGRGGMKLEGALERFCVDVTGRICADVGASTGGFTDCLLQRGAAHVYAIDSGHGQLDPKLAEDSRVTNLEGCNARYLTAEQLGQPCTCAVSDLSFISQTLVLPAVSSILTDGAVYIALIKPQFECGREAVGRGGLVKDKKQHIAAINRVIACAAENGLAPCGIMKSPITGGDGNTEFLMMAVKNGTASVSGKAVTEAVYE